MHVNSTVLIGLTAIHLLLYIIVNGKYFKLYLHIVLHQQTQM